MGEPRAGRSDLAEGLTRVLSSEATRLPLGDDLDFFDRDRTHRAEVEVVLGDLGTEFQQRFFDRLEYWDAAVEELVPEAEEPELLDAGDLEPVVRLCYRAAWSENEDQAQQWVDYPKTSEIDGGLFDRVRRSDLEALPFFAGRAGGRPLSLAARAHLRSLVAEAAGGDFGQALDRMGDGIVQLAAGLASAQQIREALDAILAPVRVPLAVEGQDVEQLFRFVPEGGALGNMLRSLAPTLELSGGGGYLPLWRHGTTATALLAASELVASAGSSGIVVIDDFGEHLDAGGARHLAATLRARTGQLWLTTRRASVAAVFRPSEVVRLGFSSDGHREVFHGRDPRDKAERLAARHFGLQVLPAMTARAIVLVEGPHDRSSLDVVADRLLREQGIPLPAAHRVAFADAGAAEGSGGVSALPRLAHSIKQLGFFTVAVADGDRAQQSEAEIASLLEAADAVIRLPDGFAIELALLHGLTDETIRATLRELDADLPTDLDDRVGPALRTLARKTLKQRGGLHAQFLDALPVGCNPDLACRILETAVRVAAASDPGLTQL